MLQEECDRQAERVLAEFRRKRSVRDKVARVRDVPPSSFLAASSSAAVTMSSSSSSQPVSAKELDHVLSEMVLLQARSEMYYRFLRKRVTVSEL